jgi:hypothetical protein
VRCQGEAHYCCRKFRDTNQDPHATSLIQAVVDSILAVEYQTKNHKAGEEYPGDANAVQNLSPNCRVSLAHAALLADGRKTQFYD